MFEVLENSKGFNRFKKSNKEACYFTLKSKYLYESIYQYGYFSNFKEIMGRFKEEERFTFINYKRNDRKEKKNELIRSVIKGNTIGSIKNTRKKKTSKDDLLQDDYSAKLIEKYESNLINAYSVLEHKYIDFGQFLDLLTFLKFFDIKKKDSKKRLKNNSKMETTVSQNTAESVFSHVYDKVQPKKLPNIFSEEKQRRITIGFTQFQQAIRIILGLIYKNYEFNKMESLFITNHLSETYGDKEQDTFGSERQFHISNTDKGKKNKEGREDKYLNRLKEITEMEGLAKLIMFLDKTVHPLFDLACNERDYLTFDQFFNLFKGFDIFPSLISKFKLDLIYNALIVFTKIEYMTSETFTFSFILIADEISNRNSIRYKLNFLLRLINQSQGYLKLTQKYSRLSKHKLELNQLINN